jgi:diaminohydroxyphosphoribosylaminopyrimidine deaminase / 5-amino-6-(5-phosphoribosylamino)uracil reductase
MSDGHDDRLLARTLELAHQGAGRVEPNPRVGALIVNAGEIVATGYHHHYGGLHAEVEAIRCASTSVRGATLYCNMEPCSHRSPGKHQPPCTEAIIDAGIARVVIGQQDPNPAVRGRGVRALRRAGLSVDLAPDSSLFLRENEAFNTVMALGRPFVHLKAALSLDGRIATASGDSRWITDEEARIAAHRLRSGLDAVLVGRQTVETDDPALTVRYGLSSAGDQPRPIVLDSDARIPLTSRLVRERASRLIVCVGPRAAADRVRTLEERGVTVQACTEQGGYLDPAEVLATLHRNGINSLLIEGGSRVISSFLRARLFDRLTLYYAPILLGAGRDAVNDLSIAWVADAIHFERVRWTTIGSQQCFDAYRSGWHEEILAVMGDEGKEGADDVHGTD